MAKDKYDFSDEDLAGKPKFSEDADKVGNSRLWLPVLAALLFFLIGAAALMLFTSLWNNNSRPQVPDQPSQEQPAQVTNQS